MLKSEYDGNETEDGIYRKMKKRRVNVDPGEESVKRIYEELQKLNANGIIGLKIQQLPPVPTTFSEKIYYGSGYAISGMAIKR